MTLSRADDYYLLDLIEHQMDVVIYQTYTLHIIKYLIIYCRSDIESLYF